MITFGGMAKKAWGEWKKSDTGAASTVPASHLTHPTMPESAGGTKAEKAANTKKMLAEWNAALEIIFPLITKRDVSTPALIPYGEAFTDGEMDVRQRWVGEARRLRSEYEASQHHHHGTEGRHLVIGLLLLIAAPPSIQDGAPDRILLEGRVLRPSGPIDGEVLVVKKNIRCVAESCASQAGGATVMTPAGSSSPA